MNNTVPLNLFLILLLAAAFTQTVSASGTAPEGQSNNGGDSDHSLTTGDMIAIIASAVAFVAAVTVLIVVCCCMRKQTDSDVEDEDMPQNGVGTNSNSSNQPSTACQRRHQRASSPNVLATPPSALERPDPRSRESVAALQVKVQNWKTDLPSQPSTIDTISVHTTTMNSRDSNHASDIRVNISDGNTSTLDVEAIIERLVEEGNAVARSNASNNGNGNFNNTNHDSNNTQTGNPQQQMFTEFVRENLRNFDPPSDHIMGYDLASFRSVSGGKPSTVGFTLGKSVALPREGRRGVYREATVTVGANGSRKLLAEDVTFFSKTTLGYDFSGTISKLTKNVSSMCAMVHPNLLPYQGVAWDEDLHRIFVVSDFCSAGSLKEYIAKNGPISPSLAACFTREVLAGLEFLHSRDDAHGMIRCSNMMLSDTGSLRLKHYAASWTDNYNGSGAKSSWSPPEVAKKSVDKFLPEHDIWAVGCAVIEMVTGEPPFAHLSPVPFAMLQCLLAGKVPPLPDMPADVTEFVKACLQVDPAARPSAYALLQTTFLQQCSASSGLSATEDMLLLRE